MTNTHRVALLVCLILVVGTNQGSTAASDYPARPVRIVVPVPPGGAADMTARIIGQHLSEIMRQTVVIDNRPGGSGIIATSLVAKATPDAYTILEDTIMTHGIGLHLFHNLPYDAVKDFAPIIHINTIPLIMVVNRDVPATSVADLIAVA